MSQIQFQNRSFCFTGKLAELCRDKAEEETRARGGLTTSTISEQLDYLVIGSIPSPSWKHGNFGNKIEKAKEIFNRSQKRPVLVPESDFMESLAEYASINDGTIDEKIFVCKVRFYVGQPPLNEAMFKMELNKLILERDCHITVYKEQLDGYRKLFILSHHPELENAEFVVKCRIIKRFPVDSDSDAFKQIIVETLKSLENARPKIESFERTEGTASFIKLLREIPNFNIKS